MQRAVKRIPMISVRILNRGVLIVLLVVAASAGASISGRVVDMEGNAVAGAVARLVVADLADTTDSEGAFAIEGYAASGPAPARRAVQQFTGAAWYDVRGRCIEPERVNKATPAAAGAVVIQESIGPGGVTRFHKTLTGFRIRRALAPTAPAALARRADAERLLISKEGYSQNSAALAGAGPVGTLALYPLVQVSESKEGTGGEFLSGDTVSLDWQGPICATEPVDAAASIDGMRSWTKTAVFIGGGSACTSGQLVLPQLYNRSRCALRLTQGAYELNTGIFSVRDLLLVKPVSGAAYSAGDTLTVEWRAFATTTSVAAYLYPMGPRGPAVALMENASTTVSMSRWPAIWPRQYWVIPDTMQCDSCYLMIEDYMDPSISDAIEGVFSIAHGYPSQ